jgi:hypothetical protein
MTCSDTPARLHDRPTQTQGLLLRVGTQLVVVLLLFHWVYRWVASCQQVISLYDLQ